jgi:hypothetical protein
LLWVLAESGEKGSQNQQTRRDAFPRLLIDNVLNAIRQV